MLSFDPFAAAEPFVLLEDNRQGSGRLFRAPQAMLSCSDPTALVPTLDRLESAVRGGAFAAGWMGYEAGLVLEPRLAGRAPPTQPLLWFGLFNRCELLDAAAGDALWRQPEATPQRAGVRSITPAWTAPDHAQKLHTILDYIAAGDIYQANLTFPVTVAFDGAPAALYRHLREAQRAPFSALIFTGDRWILSFSPELFFDLHKGQITTQPMKGTAARAGDPALDAALAASLHGDAKNRAENLMIVDLLRNDLSKVSVPGSVDVPALFDIVSYATVHQMVSTITAQLQPGKSAVDILKALFPCGSVTGAPKIRAMEILHELEAGPRGLYCGAIGAIAPDGDARFSVAIRTLEVTAPGTAVMGVGGGIVADSIAADEYAECLLKSAFLHQPLPPFDLIETMLWQPEAGWQRWGLHMQRLARSAAHFGFTFDAAAVHAEAALIEPQLTGPQRVRLLLGRHGARSWQWQPAPLPFAAPPSVVLAPQRVHSSSMALYHKTSHRAYYDDTRRRLAATTGCVDCLFLNERDELTEGSIANLFIRRHHLLLTPPVSSGLLPGVLRQSLLDTGQAREAVLTLEDVRHADALLLGNSVRGLFEVTLEEN